MTTRNFNNSRVAAGTRLAGRVPRIVVIGDSKSNLDGNLANDSSLYWALAISGSDFKMSSADNLGVSGSTASLDATATTNGAGQSTTLGFAHDTNVARITARIAACVAAGEVVWVWCQFGTNSNSNDTSILAAYLKVIPACRAAGASLFLIKETPPVAAGGSNANIMSSNARVANWADTQNDVRVLTHFYATLDPTNSTSQSLGGTGGAAYSATKDGVHESSYGAYLQGKAIAPQLVGVFPKAKVRYGGKGDIYGGGSIGFFGTSVPTVALECNMFRNPMFSGTGGTNSVTASGTGSVTGSVPDFCSMTGTLTGNMSIAISQVASPDINNIFGRTDFTACRLTLSGTPTSNTNIHFQNNPSGPAQHPLFASAGNHPVRSQVMLRANNLTGLCGFGPKHFNRNYGQESGSYAAYAQLPVLNDLFFIGSTDGTMSAAGSPAYASPPGVGVHFQIRAGVAVSGSVDVIFADTRLITALPASL